MLDASGRFRKRDWFYVSPRGHVAHFRNDCPSYLRSYYRKDGSVVGLFLIKKPRGKTLCDHCQNIEKRERRK